MAIQTTLIGNLTADPELSYTQGGLPVASCNVAINERIFDKQANEWKDGEATFVRLSIWREMGEYAASSLTKGTRVIVTGKLRNRKYQDRDGNDRWSLEMQVDEIGPSLRYATATVYRAERQSGRPQEPVNYSGHPEDPGADAWTVPGTQPQPAHPQPAQPRFTQQQQQQQQQPIWPSSPNDYGDDSPF